MKLGYVPWGEKQVLAAETPKDQLRFRRYRGR